MKIFYQIIIVLFVALSLFLVKDDVVLVLGNVSSYLNKNIKSPIIKLTEKEEILPSKVDTPGALRVVNDLFKTNNDISLSKENVILLTNRYRKENDNLKALVENRKLNLSAEKKLQDMFNNQYFEHKSPSGLGIGDLVEKVGYEYILIGENLAMGNFKDEASLLDAWVASPGHRENIVNKHYTEIGVALGKGKFEGKDIWMAVQHFGAPRSICPLIDQVLYGKIILNQNKLKEMENELVLRREMISKGGLYEGNTHYEQIDIYNSLINPYNSLIKDTKQKIENYNNQIRAFNLCLLDNQ
jgi:uncharacterized protein YkwD